MPPWLQRCHCRASLTFPVPSTQVKAMMAVQLKHLLMARRGFAHPSDQVELSKDSRAQKFWVFWLVGFKHKDFDTDLFIFKFAGLITGIA